MSFNPLCNPRVSFPWSLPEKAVGLAAKNFGFNPWNAVNENCGLFDVIGTHYIAVSYHHERGYRDITKPWVASQLLRANTSRTYSSNLAWCDHTI